MTEWRHETCQFCQNCHECGDHHWPCDAEQMRLRAERAEAALRRIVDKRTADSDGYWISAREMRYAEEALG